MASARAEEATVLEGPMSWVRTSPDRAEFSFFAVKVELAFAPDSQGASLGNFLDNSGDCRGKLIVVRERTG